MKYLISLGVMVIISAIFWFSCMEMISPGYVGVVVNLLGNEKGVEEKELHVGMHFIPPWKEIYRFPTFEQNITWEGDKDGFNFQTKEGMAIHGDLGITFHLDPECVPVIFQRYRRGMDEISNLFIRNSVRDAVNLQASRMSIEDLYGAGKEEFFQSIQAHLTRELSTLGIRISRIYLIGRFNFPAAVVAALNAKIEATQRAQQRENELREAEAEAKKQVAKAEGQAKCQLAKAHAEAEANRMIAASVTCELIQWQFVDKWDGKMPSVVGGDSKMLIPINGLVK